ncbi:hypothetical protein BAY60_31790 [Prauserella muralis]|uniref:HTH araC/xylS-type domain-containing protein n=1 Tax=Prauserella muralis TaxID=588067 RepID=A0A2V4AJB6_9PSEU|nr:hypothetical protein BAY60_31790 [Prauserella muralis]
MWRARIGASKPIVPDGCLDLMVAGDLVFVAGPDTRAWQASLASPEIHGIRFRPGRAPSALGVAADELTDRRVPLEQLWGRDGAAAAELLRERPAALAEVVARRLAPRPDPEVDALLARLGGGVPRVADALAGLPTSERQLRRRFTVAVGYGPATYLRVARLQRAIALAPRVTGLATLAAQAGYADQAHLTRDCRELTGATPRAYFPLGQAVRAG